MSQNPSDSAESDPLGSKQVISIGDWAHWLALWNERREISVLTGLLHDGFDVECDDPVARAIFYLRVANGHTSYNMYSTMNRRDMRPSAVEDFGRSKIRHKAFQMLCARVFSGSITTFGDPPHWQWIAESPELLDAIIGFFRLDWKFQTLENLRVGCADSEPPTRKAVSFLTSLCHEALDVRNRCAREQLSKAARGNLKSRRSKFVPILHGLGRHDMLVLSGRGTSPEVMDPLEEIATKMEWRNAFGSEVRPNSFQHAVALGSPPALTLVQLQAKKEASQEFEKT